MLEINKETLKLKKKFRVTQLQFTNVKSRENDVVDHRKKNLCLRAYGGGKVRVTTCFSNEISHVEEPLCRSRIHRHSLLMSNSLIVFITCDPRGLTLGLTISLIVCSTMN